MTNKTPIEQMTLLEQINTKKKYVARLREFRKKCIETYQNTKEN